MSLADTHEPPPVPNDRPAVWSLVIADMQARDREGRRKYGTPLQPFNGRDALVDAYQEALDLVVYLRQAIEERTALRANASPAPGNAEVREAAEAIARRLFGSREHVALWDAINEFREAPNLIASEHAVVRVEDGLRAVILAALASPPAAPARDEVREAAEVIRTILTAHDARLSESGVLTYGPPSKGTGFVAAIQWLRRYDAARGGE